MSLNNGHIPSNKPKTEQPPLQPEQPKQGKKWEAGPRVLAVVLGLAVLTGLAINQALKEYGINLSVLNPAPKVAPKEPKPLGRNEKAAPNTASAKGAESGSENPELAKLEGQFTENRNLFLENIDDEKITWENKLEGFDAAERNAKGLLLKIGDIETTSAAEVAHKAALTKKFEELIKQIQDAQKILRDKYKIE